MCKTLDENISFDEKNNYIAEWHDESHINHYCKMILEKQFINFKVLNKEYHVFQESLRNYKKVILLYLDKTQYLKQSSSVKNLKSYSKNTHGRIILNDFNKEYLKQENHNLSIAFMYKYNVGGLGDMIKGMVNCLVLSRLIGCSLYFDINHPIKNHFTFEEIPEEKKCVTYDVIDFTLHKDRNILLDKLLSNLMFNQKLYKDKTVSLFCNISFEDKLRTIVPNESINSLYEQAYKQIFDYFVPRDYLITNNPVECEDIIHIRFGDKYLREATASKNDERSGNLTSIKKFLNEVYEKYGTCKIVSDNNELLESFGPEITEKFILETRKSIHFAYETTKDEDLVPTLQTFFDFQKYKNIIVKSYSGFSSLASLCFDINYINYTDLYTNKLTIVSGCSQNHFYSLIEFLNSCKNIEIPYSIIVYDLGIEESCLERLENDYPNISLRTFDYSKYPDYYNISKNAGEYAWKPAIIKEVSDEIKTGVLLWCDSGNLFTGNVKILRDEILKRNIYSPISDGDIKKWTHPLMLKYFNDRKMIDRKNKKFLSLKNRNGAILGFNLNNKNILNFIDEFASLANIKECIAPEGSNRSNHRQDQALFTLLYYRIMNDFDFVDKYISLSIHNDV